MATHEDPPSHVELSEHAHNLQGPDQSEQDLEGAWLPGPILKFPGDANLQPGEKY